MTQEPHIILIMQPKELTHILFTDDLCVCEDDGEVMVFSDFEVAKKYQDDNAIDGRVIKLPTY